MNGDNEPDITRDRLDPRSLTIDDIVRVLSAAGGKQITLEMLQECIDAGAPTNIDGSVNLLFFAAWLVKEMFGGGN